MPPRHKTFLKALQYYVPARSKLAGFTTTTNKSFFPLQSRPPVSWQTTPATFFKGASTGRSMTTLFSSKGEKNGQAHHKFCGQATIATLFATLLYSLKKTVFAQEEETKELHEILLHIQEGALPEAFQLMQALKTKYPKLQELSKAIVDSSPEAAKSLLERLLKEISLEKESAGNVGFYLTYLHVEAFYNTLVEKWEDAFKIFKFLLIFYPDNADVARTYGVSHLNKASALLKLPNKEDEVLYHLDEALRLLPLGSTAAVYALVGKGELLHRRNDLRLALECYEQAIPMISSDSSLLNELLIRKGYTLVGLGRYKQAIECCDKVIATSQMPDTKAFIVKGMALFEQQRYEEALAHYDKAIATDPSTASDKEFALTFKGYTLLYLQKYGEAEKIYQQVIALNPENLEAYNNQGICLENQGRDTEALLCLKKALALKPDRERSVGILNNQAIIYAKLNQHEKAVSIFNRALAFGASEETGASICFNIANSLVKLKRYNEAIIHYDKAISLNPQSVSSYNNKGLVLLLLGNAREAIQYLQQAITLRPDIGVFYSNMAKCLIELRYYQKAKDYYDKAIRLDDKNEAIKLERELLAIVLADIPDKIKKQQLDRALEKLPPGQVRRNLERSYERMEKTKKSASQLEEAHHKSLQEKWTTTPLHTAVKTAAIDAIQEYLKHDPKNINAVDEMGKTPLMLAAETGNTDVIKLLLAANADPNSVLINISDNSRIYETAFSLAKKNRHFKACELLLRHHAPFSKENIMALVAEHVDKIALEYSSRRKDDALLDYLVSGLLGRDMLEIRYSSGTVEKYRAHLEDKAGVIGENLVRDYIRPKNDGLTVAYKTPASTTPELESFEVESWTIDQFLPLRARFYLKTLIALSKDSSLAKTMFPKDYAQEKLQEIIIKELLLTLEAAHTYHHAISLNEVDSNEKRTSSQEMLDAYLDNMVDKICNLGTRQEYTVPSGYHEHTLYLNFFYQDKRKGLLGVRIDNLGSLSEDHQQEEDHSLYPYFIKPWKLTDEAGKKVLKAYLYDNFCAKHATLSSTWRSGQAFTNEKWLFQHDKAKLTREEFKKLIYLPVAENMVTAGIPYWRQSVGNCVVKNNNFGMLQRLRDPDLMAALLMQEKLTAVVLQEDSLELSFLARKVTYQPNKEIEIKPDVSASLYTPKMPQPAPKIIEIEDQPEHSSPKAKF